MDWYPWYPALFEADTMHLTTEEVGAYKLLIDRYMVTRQPLLDHDQALANITRLPLQQWLNICSNLRPFFKARGGKLHHKRCDAELERQDSKVKKLSEAGKNSAEKRRSQKSNLATEAATEAPTKAATKVRTEAATHAATSDDTPAAPNGLETQRSEKSSAASALPTEAATEEIEEEKERKNPPTPQGGREVVDTVDSDFSTWYAAYPLHKGRGQALRAYRTARKKASAETLIAGARRYAADENRKPDFTKHPATWLNGECWADDAAPAADPLAIPDFLDRRPRSEAKIIAGRPTACTDKAVTDEYHRLHAWLTKPRDPSGARYWISENWGAEPTDEAKVQARLAALAPVIWPDAETQLDAAEATR